MLFCLFTTIFFLFTICHLSTLDPPSSPSDLCVTSVDPDSISLSWTPPRSDGGTPIQSIILEIKHPKEDRYTFLEKLKPRSKEYTVFGLEEGQQYSFRIKAKNLAGESSSCEICEPVCTPVAKSAIGKHFNDILSLLLCYFEWLSRFVSTWY